MKDWLRVIGPGAVIASLTIGSGELIFSSRGGSIFGYDLLWFFLAVLALKWSLVYTSARHMVLTGAHPFQRWIELPGPRGWLLVVLLLLALVAFPIWVSFHAATIGGLLNWLCGTESAFGGHAHYLWGAAILFAVLGLVLAGGYATLERTQLVIVGLMLAAVLWVLLRLAPPWADLLAGLLWPHRLHYPVWASAHPDLVAQPVWVETVTYVGVLGGSAYDYLAYVSFVREKGWGRAGGKPLSYDELVRMPHQPKAQKQWLRVLLADCTTSFLAVLLFSGVFVTCGAMILAPQHKIPGGTNLLALQADFVALFPWMKPLYFAGAFLTMLGTLYGTIEVAPTVLRETAHAFDSSLAGSAARRLRLWAVLWSSGGGLVILLGSFAYGQSSAQGQMPGLIALLTPANLFTGVLGCGIICLLTPWTESRFVPPAQRLPWALWLLNGTAAVIFGALGIKAYWDQSQWRALALLAGTVVAGWLAASFLDSRRRFRQRPAPDQSTAEAR